MAYKTKENQAGEKKKKMPTEREEEKKTRVNQTYLTCV
jgi:hypothetical protein